MCIYCGTKNYRKIYEHHHGKVPKDNEGRSYDIHHIDGNHSNNHPDNLTAVSLREHYDIHYSRGDWGGCYYMAGRLKLSPAELSELATKRNLNRVAKGIHPFTSGNIQSRNGRKRVENGTHEFLDSDWQRANQLKRLKEGTHPFVDNEGQQRRALKRVSEGNHHFTKIWDCPHCGKTGKGTGTYTRWHGDNCKMKQSP